MKLPFLISVPHAGLAVPLEVKDRCILTEQEIREDGDEGAAEIYYRLRDHAVGFVTTDIARAIVDMNRAENDLRKDGIIKTHTCWDVPVYDVFPSKEIIERLMSNYYRPYHKKITESTEGARLGIDCHTMAAVGPPVGPDTDVERPHICLSNADGTCPRRWVEFLRDCFEKVFEVDVSVNHPFRGGFIIRSHSREIPWAQLELSRAAFVSNEEKGRRVLQALQQVMKYIE